MSNALTDPEQEAKRREKTREYVDFLDDAGNEGLYAEKIRNMVAERRCRLIVNINDLRRRYPRRCQGLLSNESFEEIVCFQEALKEIVSNYDPAYSKEKEDFYVGFEGSFGHRHVNPRSLKATYIGNLVCVEGIVTKCSLVRPKVVRSVHYCPATQKTHERRYTDLTSYDAFPSSTVYPTEDENRNPLETEYGLSVYKDHQTFSVQELPELAPAGQLPRSLDIVADNDLADQCKPGDRVRVIGVYRCLPNKQGGFTTGAFKTILIANNTQLMSKDTGAAAGSEEMKLVSKFRRMKIDHFEVLARSLAPSICGHEEVKRAILSMLLGGQEKILPNGTRLRGDINILLIGDPSVAKSQLLRYVLHSAPRAIPTTGRGSSGVGLTAAVTSDSETGERRLEAGAMVLADRGIVCIDEFDKMSDIDRTAIHEVMEQGRVSIAKAGIHAKLNARCAVLAAANPVYGRYDIYKSPMENIGMQDSLLSRFDLCFVLLDEHKADRDRMIAEHVIRIHQYRKPGEDAGTVTEVGQGIESLTTLSLDDQEAETEIFQNKESWSAGERTEKLVTIQFMRKYLSVAKECKPVLSPEAAAFIADKYADLRDFDEKKSDRERTTPVTARMLETMIRLATAHAKARMSGSITRKDAEMSFELLHFACFKEKPKERLEDEGRTNGEAGNGEEEGMDEVVVRRTTKSRRGEEEDPDESAPVVKRARTEPAVISAERYKSWRTHLRTAFDSKQADTLHLKTLISEIQSKVSTRLQFSEEEVTAAISRMSDENIAMVDDQDNVILI